MRKVQWIRLVLACALMAAVTFNWDNLRISAQSSPSSLPLLSEGGLSYLGGFRVPAIKLDGADFSYGGKPMAYNPANNSLFIGNLNSRVAEISIPTPVISSDPTAMPTADLLQQALVDPTEGHLRDITTNSIFLSGLLVYGNRLYGSAVIYYDASNVQRVSHFSRSLQLTQPSFSGWSQVWETGRAGFVAGMMSLVPAEWQSLLGGPAITGQCCLSIITRTSFGPAAFAFDPAKVGQASVAAQPLVYYDAYHTTLGPWEGTNPTYGASTNVDGVAVVAGTRTVLFVGSNGLGPYCYGEGTADRAAADASGGSLCYDPAISSKGPHSYPYRYQIWAYDLNDFAAVKAGSKQPWEVVPYGVWPLTFPTPERTTLIGGVGYDPQRQILYVSQLLADQIGYGMYPIIHAFRLNAAAGSAAPASSLTSDVSLTANKTAPQAIGNAVEFTAQPTGGIAPHQYKWLLYDGVSSKALTDWTTSNKYVWTPTSGNPSYRMWVWVRGAGNTADALEASASMPFAISDAAKTSSVALTANRVAPQAPFTAITWTAAPTGGVAPHQYKWLVSDGTTTTVAANWSTVDSFVWTPSTANANYRVEVWVRSAGNSADVKEASGSAAFPIATVATPVASVAISANKAEPQQPGTAITWSATPSGGTAPFVYKWFVFDGSNWNVVASWGSNAAFAWTPTVANANYRVRVWVKAASNTADQPEAAADKGFSITTPPAPAAPTSIAPVTAVTLTSNKSSPQPAGTMVGFTAQAAGGVGPYEYQWWTFEDQKWSLATPWGAYGALNWSRNIADPKYQVQVRARSAGSTNNNGEARATIAFVLHNGNGKDK